MKYKAMLEIRVMKPYLRMFIHLLFSITYSSLAFSFDSIEKYQKDYEPYKYCLENGFSYLHEFEIKSSTIYEDFNNPLSSPQEYKVCYSSFIPVLGSDNKIDHFILVYGFINDLVINPMVDGFVMKTVQLSQTNDEESRGQIEKLANLMNLDMHAQVLNKTYDFEFSKIAVMLNDNKTGFPRLVFYFSEKQKEEDAQSRSLLNTSTSLIIDKPLNIEFTIERLNPGFYFFPGQRM